MSGKKVYITGVGGFTGTTPDSNNNFKILDDEYEPSISGRQLRGVDRVSRLSIAAAVSATDKCNLKMDRNNDREYGLFYGTIYGALESVHEFDMVSVSTGALSVNPSLFPSTVLNSPACQVGIQLAISGPIYTVCSGIMSSLDAVGLGYLYVHSQAVPAAVAGGAEVITEMQQLMHKGRSRQGEAGGFIVMETEDTINDTSSIAAEILGYSTINIGASQTSHRIAELVVGMLEERDLTFGDIQKVYYGSYLDKSVDNELIGGLQDSLHIKDRLEQLETDWMGASGVIQIVTSLNKNKCEDGRINIFINIDDIKCSVIILKKIGG